MIDEPTFHSSNANGPVPLALFSRPVASACSTAPPRRVSWYVKSLSGCGERDDDGLVVGRLDRGDRAPAPAASLAPSARCASSDHTTSADVSGSPLWNVTPSCSVNVYIVPSSDTSGSSARPGSIVAVVVGREQRLVDVVEQDLVERGAGHRDEVEARRLEHGADDDLAALAAPPRRRRRRRSSPSPRAVGAVVAAPVSPGAACRRPPVVSLRRAVVVVVVAARGEHEHGGGDGAAPSQAAVRTSGGCCA